MSASFAFVRRHGLFLGACAILEKAASLTCLPGVSAGARRQPLRLGTSQEVTAPMTHLSKALLGMAAVAVLAMPSSLAGQGMQADAARAANGLKLWKKHGCVGCHAIGKRLAGPDLAGVSERRSSEWLHRWMKDTKAMLEMDSTAKAMMAESKGARMPQFRLTDSDIDDLLHYIAQETAKKRAGA